MAADAKDVKQSPPADSKDKANGAATPARSDSKQAPGVSGGAEELATKNKAAIAAFKQQLEAMGLAKEYSAPFPLLVRPSVAAAKKILGIFLGAPADSIAMNANAPSDWNPFRTKTGALTDSIADLEKFLKSKNKPSLEQWYLVDCFLHKFWKEGNQKATKVTLADAEAAEFWCKQLFQMEKWDVVVAFGSQTAWVVSALTKQRDQALQRCSEERRQRTFAKKLEKGENAKPARKSTSPAKLTNSHFDTSHGDYLFPFEAFKHGAVDETPVYFCHHPAALFTENTKEYNEKVLNSALP